MTEAREAILRDVRAALGRSESSPVAPMPATAGVRAREPGSLEDEVDLLLAEVRRLDGVAKRVPDRGSLASALAGLVNAEAIRKATLWSTSGLVRWGVAEALRALGVELIAPGTDPRDLAECDLGVTEADAAIPETGTLLLRSSAAQPRSVSLLPRVHLAILTPAVLRPDLHHAFAEVSGSGYCVLITGPSRTADIELAVTIGVHGPRALHVWVVEQP